MWLIVSTLALHNLHLLFCSVLSIFVSTVLIGLFSAAIRRDLDYLLRLPFLSRVQVFSCEISLYYNYFGLPLDFEWLQVSSSPQHYTQYSGWSICKASFSLLRFLFLSHVQILSCEILSLLFLSLLFTPLEFFTSELADIFSLEFEWQQVSSGLQDSSQDSSRS